MYSNITKRCSKVQRVGINGIYRKEKKPFKVDLMGLVMVSLQRLYKAPFVLTKTRAQLEEMVNIQG